MPIKTVLAEQALNVPVKIWTDEIEHEALNQLRNMAKMSFVHKHVAVMPDVHYGIGATVGSVVATKGAIIPAAVGVDIGCFSGDTLIPLLDGKDYPIKDLVDKGEFVIYSIVNTDRITTAKATAKLTRKNQRLVKITLDNDEVIKCTLDHQFMLRDGSYKEAQHLIVGQSLMPLYKELDKDGYVLVQQPYSKQWQRAHWIVGRSGLMGEIPSVAGKNKRTVIHHINFNESDNNPDNLQFMGDSDHASYHRKLVENNTHWQSPEFEEKRLKACREFWKSDEGKEKMGAVVGANFIKWSESKSEEFIEWSQCKGEMGKPILIAYNTSERGKAKSKEVSNKYYDCDICGESIKSHIGVHNHKKKTHQVNHKIKEIEITDIYEDVYCLTVPEYNNFALSAGVFVHNCGMCAVPTNLTANDLPDDLKKVRHSLEREIPVGENFYKDGDHIHKNEYRLMDVESILPMLDKYKITGEKVARQCGTLGGGNHFIELCLDESDNVWIMLHSGSRGIGNKIGRTFISAAREDMRIHHINLPDKDLAYVSEGTTLFNDYVGAVEWAQNYAKLNRMIMLRRIVRTLKHEFPQLEVDIDARAVNCHHNYISREHHYGSNVYVTRKGAVRARVGDRGIIPGSMGAKSFIVEGLGNEESFCSCSHGAGRKMSRTKAKQHFTLEDHERATAGVECKKDASVLDETPGAYKDIDVVMDNQSDLVQIKHTLKQFLCIKG